MGYTEQTLSNVNMALQVISNESTARPELGIQPVALSRVLYVLQRVSGLTKSQARSAVSAAATMGVIIIDSIAGPHGDQRLKYVSLTESGIMILSIKPGEQIGYLTELSE